MYSFDIHISENSKISPINTIESYILLHLLFLKVSDDSIYIRSNVSDVYEWGDTMIEVRDINIFFRKIIIKDSTIKLNPSTITLLTGKSGSGKTCLLNVIGLLDDTNAYSFLYNNEIIDKKEYVSFRKKYVSYVYQEHNMLEEVSVFDNFKIQYSLIGIKYNKEEISKILYTVLLDDDILSRKVKSLSGGQKQRVAIAIALIKHPKLLLLDEPTASLDEVNTKQVIKVLDTIRESGVTIVIATHNPSIYDSDVIYSVDNRRLVTSASISDKEHIDLDSTKVGKSKLFGYPLIQLRNHKILYVTVLLMFTLISSIYLQIQLSNLDYNQAMDIIINAVETDEIAISYENVIYDEAITSSVSLHINENQQSYIRNIDGIIDVFPYYETSASDLSLDENGLLFSDETYNYSVVEHDSTSVNVIDYTGVILNIGSVKTEYQVPRCTTVDHNVSNGVFISSTLATKLGINELNNTEISFYMPTYLGYYVGYQEETLDDQQNYVPGYDVNIDLITYTKTTYPIKGIYEDAGSINQFYSYAYTPQILIDYQEIERLHDEVLVDGEIPIVYQDIINSWLGEEVEIVPEIRNGLLVIKVDESSMDKVYGDLLDIEPKLNVKNVISMENDLVARRDLLTFTTNVIEIIVMIVSVILVLITYSYILAKRKKELSYLAAQGVKSAFLLPVIDIFYILIAIFPICIIQATLYRGIYADIPLASSITTVVTQYLLLFVIFIFIITIFTYMYYRKVNIASELRSK